MNVSNTRTLRTVSLPFFSPPQFWHRAGERRTPTSPLPAQPAAGRTSGETEEE